MQLKVIILDVLGNEVATINNGKLDAGQHILNWNASGFASGIYYYEVEGNDFNITRKMMLLK